MLAQDAAPIVAWWWVGMCALAAVNIALLLRLHRWVRAAQPDRLERLSLSLCAIYTLGCASRCLIPRSDVARFGLVDSWLSSILIGRSIATVAELAFVAQWVLLLVYFGRRAQRQSVRLLSAPILPLITLAQCCAWYGVLTTNYIGQTLEESLWTLSALLLSGGLWLCRQGVSQSSRRWLDLTIAGCVAYILFMGLIDVPNYYRLWQAKEAAGASYLSLSEGLRDLQQVTITGTYERWRYPMVWQSLYFSLAVWASMGFVLIPMRLRRQETA